MLFKRKQKKPQDDRSGLVVVNKPTSVVSEQFRTLRTNIQFSMIDDTLKTIVVTSAEPNAGKSTVSANLAATFASEEKKVLLVDADLRKPTIHKIFKVRNKDGLTTLLTNRDTQLDEVVYGTQKEGLFILTSGAIPPNPAELLGSKRMLEIIKEMEAYFDLIVFDMPPILAVTDAQVMASKVDGTLFVIPKGSTKQDLILKSKDLLEKVNANVLGAVLNRVNKSDEEYYYYYGE